ncbi:LssY C-terminal domain-containing protein [Paraburkholderia sp. JPY419]|uniref:LssY C-terminal domain-containing protein n=1 Tax=Paraburkholderia sp. JPY419 TaxID=667660 RepID=UPI003D1E9979
MTARAPMHRARMRAGALLLVLTLAGCATWQAPSAVDEKPLREREVSDTHHGVRVGATVMSSEDIKRIYGADINDTKVQPLWIEVHNGTSQALWLLRSGTDPDYFSPDEVAWSMHTMLGGSTNRSMDDYFRSLRFGNPIAPGATQWGILFTNPDRGIKLVNIDLFGNHTLIPFSLFLRVPDSTTDPSLAQIPFPFPASAVTDCPDLTSLRAAIERLPCCATDATGTVQADPLNAVGIGQLTDIGAALVRRNYRRDAREIDLAQRVFGREPDFVMRKQAHAGAPADLDPRMARPDPLSGATGLHRAGRSTRRRTLRVTRRDTPDPARERR